MSGTGSRLVILGAGGHGRGTLEILRARQCAGLEVPELLGFVDDDLAHKSAGPETLQCGGLPVLGPSSWLEQHAEEGLFVILAIASARAKKALDQRLTAAGVNWATAVHPSAILGAGTQVAEGAIVGAGVVVAYDTFVGRHATINLNATVGHDCVVGDYSTIAPGVNITGNVRLGEGVEVQTNATIVPGLELGAFSRVGPGSVVLRAVGEGEFFFGNPARKMPWAKS